MNGGANCHCKRRRDNGDSWRRWQRERGGSGSLASQANPPPSPVACHWASVIPSRSDKSLILLKVSGSQRWGGTAVGCQSRWTVSWVQASVQHGCHKKAEVLQNSEATFTFVLNGNMANSSHFYLPSRLVCHFWALKPLPKRNQWWSHFKMAAYRSQNGVLPFWSWIG